MFDQISRGIPCTKELKNYKKPETCCGFPFDSHTLPFTRLLIVSAVSILARGVRSGLLDTDAGEKLPGKSKINDLGQTQAKRVAKVIGTSYISLHGNMSLQRLMLSPRLYKES